MADKFNFPNEFDYRFYKDYYSVAQGMSIQDAVNHYLKIGKKRGFAGSPLSDMHFFVGFLNSINFDRILEIGPGVVPRMEGENVFYYDVRHGDNYLAYAKEKGLSDYSQLPEIHYHADDGSLKCVDNKFDLVFSSHCIEHVYDIVKHINEVEELLSDGGVYALVVPDKRYTFDYFRVETTLGDIIERSCDPNIGHPLKVFIDSLHDAHNDSSRHWRHDHGMKEQVNGSLIAKAIADHESLNGRDPGLHAWIFTDDSFREIFVQLAEADIINLIPTRVYNTIHSSNSFCVLLERKSSM